MGRSLGFELYEALLWQPSEGYALLDLHLRRLARSARRFGFPMDAEVVRRRLLEYAEGLPGRPRKVRLELAGDGRLALEDVDVKPASDVRLALANEPVDSRDPFLRHKTSHREVYERARAAHPEADDVLLWNERRELTESCAANLVLEIDGRQLTPALESGLLDGVMRRHLLERGGIEEAVLPVEALGRASRLFLINSVRGRVDAHLPERAPR